jgi:hypothetical protein
MVVFEMNDKKQQKNKSKPNTSKPATTDDKTQNPGHKTAARLDVRSDNHYF